MEQPKPIAVQLYSVREEMDRDWRGTLEKIAEMGYLGVETAGVDAAGSAAAFKEELDRLGLTVLAAHGSLPLGPGTDEIIEMVKTLGTDRLILGGTGRDQYDTMPGIEAEAEILNAANDVCRDNGLYFGVHNHWWEYPMIDGLRAYQRLRNLLDDDIIFELDTYWAAVAGVDPVAEIISMGDRALLLHIKDGPITVDGDMVAVGSGQMDFERIIPAAKAAEWLIVELDRCASDMLEALAESYRYLTGKGLGRGKI